MKKLILLAAVSTVLLHSCSGERDEDIKNEMRTPEQTMKTENKLNSFGGTIKEESTDNLIVVDTIKKLNSPSAATPPDYNQDPSDDTEIISPGDVKPPKK